ncbi:DUF177 domain-containing protein [uncultured Alistipes sp.]|uniref:YceD family protein n=1 Tax=uncultured Alistipes sp. TaxID=538949 RepID=UPI001FA1261A|nr:DUF177 domain-containing protein [uncultured Alistipes sp.]HJC26611.1 DUF177 domain-containing protein [Candidatus Alistipes stercoravium]
MEVAQRYSIAFRGLKNGHHEFRFEVGKPLFEAFESTEIKDGACEVAVDMERSETMLMLGIRITGHVVVACDRCLEDCRIPIDFEGTLPVRFSEQEHEYDGEELWLVPGEEEVDLTQYIYESIVLSLPYQRVHPEGECNPDMLKRFRIVSDEEFSSIEAEAEACGTELREGEWAKLAALRDRMAGEEAAGGKPAETETTKD